MRQYIAALSAIAFATACGENKDYGDPLPDPNAQLSTTAAAAVTTAGMLTVDTTNETALNALNAISGHFNLMAGAKYQAQQAQGPGPRGDLAVDEACVVQTETDITYTNCDWAGNLVNGSVTRSGADIDIDLDFDRIDIEDMTEIHIDGALSVSELEMSGHVNFDLHDSDGEFTLNSSFDGSFDVVLAEGCAVDGVLEVHASASAGGVSQSIWVKAEYGPTCADAVLY